MQDINCVPHHCDISSHVHLTYLAFFSKNMYTFACNVRSKNIATHMRVIVLRHIKWHLLFRRHTGVIHFVDSNANLLSQWIRSSSAPHQSYTREESPLPPSSPQQNWFSLNWYTDSTYLYRKPTSGLLFHSKYLHASLEIKRVICSINKSRV